ncbi:MAG TPA: PAS domain S-box protein [Burkholderiaceae bacterium]|nr:PAS domain S-box protein [Burkholderiaceae bacterium]
MTSDAEARAGREQRFARQFLLFGAAVAALLALTFAAFAPPGPAVPAATAVSGAMALLFALLAWRPLWLGVSLTLGLAVIATVPAAAFIAHDLGLGESFIGLAFVPVLVCAIATVLPPWGTVAIAGLHALALLGLAGAQLSQDALAPPSAAVLRDLLVHMALLACGVVIGLMTRLALERRAQASRLREQRFEGMLAIAADWYWEMDDQFRFVHLSEQFQGASVLERTRRIGRAPWEIEGFGLEPDAMDAHRADLEAHRPFNGLLLRRTAVHGATRWFSVSGRPRFDVRGIFMGYWGVGRDVTAEHEAETARAATEARYRELFARSPSALVLHRDGVVIEANRSAAVLFGAADAHSLGGRSLLDFYDEADGSRAQAQQRLAQLDSMTSGEGLPLHHYAMRSAGGRRLRVRAVSIKVEAGGTPAVLTIYEDETERLQTEAARARSEALLSHVVSTSPDLITLTDMATGRYVMVNAAFCRLSGYARDEAIGHTSAELGVWERSGDRENFVARVRRDGQVRDLAVTFRDRRGGRFVTLVSAACFAMEGREYLVINGRDVTQIEQERLERDAILQNASIGIAMTRDRVFQLANPRFEQMFGWERGKLVGQPGSVVSVDATDYEALGREFGPALSRGESIEADRQMRRRDGSTFTCRLLACAIDREHPAQGGTIWIAEDVTEQRAVEQALQRARDAAEAANRAKSAFLANTSHEIRTPLNGLVGLARLARQPDLDDERRGRYLRQIDESAQALSGVISDILDLSKIEAGKLAIESVDFDLHVLLESIEHGYGALAEGRALTLQMIVAPGVPRRVCGDPLRVRQVLTNFMSNAVKFTEHGGVRVLVRPAGDNRLRFEVEDTGPGIDPASQARLFQPFVQADGSTTRRYGGTGLGLSICRELALLMGGEVGVRSAPGHGSLFWAELPLPPSEDAGPRSGFDELEGHLSPLAGRRVLMVEDNPVNMMIAVAMLERWGADVTQAVNGDEAIDAVSERARQGRPFDVVLMDVHMPVRGGYEATRLLRQQFDGQALPIIALTAAALTSERDEALAAGMNDFLTKPIDAQRLHDTLMRWCAHRAPAA